VFSPRDSWFNFWMWALAYVVFAVVLTWLLCAAGRPIIGVCGHGGLPCYYGYRGQSSAPGEWCRVNPSPGR
jgi:hypothetical protein